MQFLFNDKFYDQKGLENNSDYKTAKEPILATGPGLPDEEVVYVFTTRVAFDAWTKNLRLADAFDKMREDIGEARSFKGKDNTAVFKRQVTLAKRIQEDLEELSKRTGLPANSKELFLRATTQAGILEGRIFDPVMLYTVAGFTGNAVGLAVPIPDLRIFSGGFNNNVSSIQVLGICILYAGLFFGGASLFLVGAPYIEITNLGTLGFNNIASSVYAYLY